MASALAHFELAFLVILTLCLALIPELPVPRGWSLAGCALIAAQTAAVRTMRIEPFEPAKEPSRWESLDSVAEVVALVAVPALTAALLVVVFWHLARANARTRHRLARAKRIRPWEATCRRAGDRPPAPGSA